MIKPLFLASLSISVLAATGCASTGENQEFTHVYKLLPSESYMSGEEKCEKALEKKALEALDVDKIEILDDKSAMKIDMETGKSSVECTIMVAPPLEK